jgi:carbamoyl-phosphate synthase large subunit
LPEEFGREIVLCEYLPGEEYSVDMLVNHGRVLALLIRIREKVISGISVRGTFVTDPEIEHQCLSIASNFQLHGPIGMQFKRASQGYPKILEINPRLQGAVSTARFAGINFPLLAIKLAMGEKMEIPEVSQEPVSFNRYWTDIRE